jgi:hypothetical protein
MRLMAHRENKAESMDAEIFDRQLGRLFLRPMSPLIFPFICLIVKECLPINFQVLFKGFRILNSLKIPASWNLCTTKER